MGINEMVRRAHENAQVHGFYDNPPELGTMIALVHSELSEALEALRNKDNKNFAVELADTVIRIADLCGYCDIDLEATIEEKMKYNETRPYKHGKKF